MSLDSFKFYMSMLTKHGSFCCIITKQIALFIRRKGYRKHQKSIKFKLVVQGHLQKELSEVELLASKINRASVLYLCQIELYPW